MEGERDPAVLSALRGVRKASDEAIRQALTGNCRKEHLFALAQALELYVAYQIKVTVCDVRIEVALARLRETAAKPVSCLPPPRHTTRQPSAPAFNARAALHALLGVDSTQVHGLGLCLALKLVGECGIDLSAWLSAKHFTSWLCLAPSNKISGGKVLFSKTRRTGDRPAALLRLAAVTVGRTDTALRASCYENRYRQRVLANLQRRAKSLGYVLQATDSAPAGAEVSQEAGHHFCELVTMRFRADVSHRGLTETRKQPQTTLQLAAGPAALMCRVLRVSVAGYYAWRRRPETRRAVESRTLLDDIREVHANSDGRYGGPRLHAALRARGKRMGRGRVDLKCRWVCC